MACAITPISAFQSTNLSNKINSYCRLADRVVRALGAPIVQVEVHQDQIFEFISMAVEWFTKYAGYTKEYLVFDSNLYIRNEGIRLDQLYTLADSSLTLTNIEEHATQSTSTATYQTFPETFYVSTTALSGGLFRSLSALSAVFADGIFENQLLDFGTYNQILTSFSTSNTLSSIPIASLFTESYRAPFTRQGSCSGDDTIEKYNPMFDYDVMDYRKVVEITEFNEGSTTGINQLFTLEQTLAQQTYFSYAMGNYGFDLVSWYTLKEWLETREKLLAIRHTWTFDPRTQYMQIYPEPTESVRFYGVIAAYLERPIRDVIKEQWVYQYALALTKIALAQIRGKYGNLTLFGGQSFNTTDLMTQGLQEKERLETLMLEGASPGFGDADPPAFMIG